MRQAVEKEDRSAYLLGLNRRLILRRLVVNGFEEKGAFTQNMGVPEKSEDKDLFFLSSLSRIGIFRPSSAQCCVEPIKGHARPGRLTCLVILRRLIMAALAAVIFAAVKP